MSERWAAALGYAGSYEVSDLGRVRSIDHSITTKDGRVRSVRGRMKRATPSASGHLTTYICGANRYVHRLVLEAFVGPCPDGMEACHNDGDPTNNRLDNLRWDTRSANNVDAVRHGHNQNRRKSHCPSGHPYDEVNTRVIASRPNARYCIKCNDEKHARRRMKAVV